jgi:hypothetical protein
MKDERGKTLASVRGEQKLYTNFGLRQWKETILET